MRDQGGPSETFPAYTHGHLNLQEYAKAFQSPHKHLIPTFPRLLFAPTSITASCNSSVEQLPLVVFNKHPENRAFFTKQALNQVKKQVLRMSLSGSCQADQIVTIVWKFILLRSSKPILSFPVVTRLLFFHNYHGFKAAGF